MPRKGMVYDKLQRFMTTVPVDYDAEQIVIATDAPNAESWVAQCEHDLGFLRMGAHDSMLRSDFCMTFILKHLLREGGLLHLHINGARQELCEWLDVKHLWGPWLYAYNEAWGDLWMSAFNARVLRPNY